VSLCLLFLVVFAGGSWLGCLGLGLGACCVCSRGAFVVHLLSVVVLSCLCGVDGGWWSPSFGVSSLRGVLPIFAVRVCMRLWLFLLSGSYLGGLCYMVISMLQSGLLG